jgi:uncharacterized damage-inducible protein DinB
MAEIPEVADLVSMTRHCYRVLRGLLEAMPEDRLDAHVGEEGLTAWDQFFHACGADIHYLNVMDGGSRRLERPDAGKAALAKMLDQVEAEVVNALERIGAEALRARRRLKWREDEVSCLWVHLHMIGHKYYHHGQLHSILHLPAEA